MATRSTTTKPAAYITADELHNIAYLIEVLDGSKADAVSLGDIPVVDVNGEKLGTLSWVDGSFRFKP